MNYLQFQIRFWLYHPALLYGYSFLLGLYFYWYGILLLVIPCLLLWSPFLIVTYAQKKVDLLKFLALSLIVFCTGSLYTKAYYPKAILPKEGIQGIAFVEIKSINLRKSFFGEKWVYQCRLKNFLSESSLSSFSSFPCTITLAAKYLEPSLRPLANQDYQIAGRLVVTEKGTYVLKVPAKNQWVALEKTWSLAEARYYWKQSVKKWIEQKISHLASAHFLAGLLTGEFDDYWMREQFARFGVQHLLAISGFHFSIIAAFLSFILSLCFPQGIRNLLLLICLSGYCFFVGVQASVLRAWIMCSLTIIGQMIDKQTTALNSLGIALLVILSYEPLLCLSVGFQFSFATTAAILLFYQPCHYWISTFLQKRKLPEVIAMNTWNQYCYCILSFLRQSISLNIAVNLIAIPLTLQYFQLFPWMSLFYNLFFPFLVTYSLALLLLGGAVSLLPFLSYPIHWFNSFYTGLILRFIDQVPEEIDSFITVSYLNISWLVLYFCLLFVVGILCKESKNVENESNLLFI